MIAIAPWIVGADGGRDGRVGEAPDTPKLLSNDVRLQLKLARIGDVLPLAAAAAAEILARRLDAIGRGLQNFDCPSQKHSRALAFDFYDGALAGYAVVGEDD